jgi:hypothetical protein
VSALPQFRKEGSGGEDTRWIGLKAFPRKTKGLVFTTDLVCPVCYTRTEISPNPEELRWEYVDGLFLPNNGISELALLPCTASKALQCNPCVRVQLDGAFVMRHCGNVVLAHHQTPSKKRVPVHVVIQPGVARRVLQALRGGGLKVGKC